MSVELPDNTKQVEDRIKADVQREAPDSNPYLKTHWLRSLIFGVARRVFDFYLDLKRTELRLFPDTADSETALKWGNIYIGAKNTAANSNGRATAQGVVGANIPASSSMTANGNEYVTSASATVSLQTLSVLSITRSGTTASVITSGNHLLSSAIPVTISGVDQSEYNVIDTDIVVTDDDSFTYQITGVPVTPATGSILSSATFASVQIESVEFGSVTNLDADTPLKLQTPIVDINDTLNADFGAIGGGSDAESTIDYKSRYLDKIRNPVAHFNKNDIVAKAKEITGVTRVFVEESGDAIGSVVILSITRSGTIAKVITATDHGFDDGQITTITGSNQSEYNVTNARILVEDSTTFYFAVLGSPVTPATGTMIAVTSIPLGMVRTFFMRDNDVSPIPTLSEVQTVKDIIDTIRPANTLSRNNIVKAPEAVVVDYTFTELIPNTATMKAAVEANIAQFHEEETTVGINVDQDAYRAAIKNTVDTETNQVLLSFELSAPSGDIVIGSGEIAMKGLVSFVL